MRVIIFRYFIKEISSTLLACVALLSVVLVSNQLAHYLTKAAAGQIPLKTVLAVLLVQVPLLLPVLLPLGLYLGILLAYARLYTDQELVVLWACGFTKMRFVCFTLLYALLIATATGCLSLSLQSHMERYKHHVLQEAINASPLAYVFPKQFTPLLNGKLVLYTSWLSRDHLKVHPVFAAYRSKPTAENPQGSWDVNVAESGHMSVDPKTHESFFMLRKGYRYSGTPKTAEYHVMHYKTYGVRMQKNALPQEKRSDTMRSIDLWQLRHGHRDMQAELQWRLSLPLSAFILAILAIPLSKVDQREGRYAKILPALLLYILYIDLLFISKAWLIAGKIPPGIGLWWVHAFMATIAVTLLVQFMRSTA